MASANAHRKKSPKVTVGWREWVQLPDLGGVWIKAKVDTGARTSALHAFQLEEVERGGQSWVRFIIQPVQKSSKQARTVEAQVVGRRSIRSSSGAAEVRPIVRTNLRLGDLKFDVDLSLTRRDEMGFRMLLGRQAIRGMALVDPGRSFLTGRPEPSS